MMSAAFSAIMMTGALVLPEVTAGMMEASTTRRRCSPFTLHGEHKNRHRYNVRTDNLISDENNNTESSEYYSGSDESIPGETIFETQWEGYKKMIISQSAQPTVMEQKGNAPNEIICCIIMTHHTFFLFFCRRVY